LDPGSLVGPYRVLEMIGAGGMGEVYLAHDTRLDRQVALKVLRGADPAGVARQRLHREAQAAARLNHPGIAAIHDVLDEGDRCFIVMEYVEGQSLNAMLDARLSVVQAVGIAAQVADALAYAHERGVIHRDVKPANVRVRPDGSAKLLDLGIARVTAAGNQSAAPSTTTALVQGTPGYMAPEQFAGGPVDARADLYSLGALLFDLLTGRPPFVGRDFLAQAVAISSGPAPRVSQFNASVPAGVDAIVARALARDPAERFQTAAAFAAALRGEAARLSGAETSESSGVAPRVRPRRALVLAGAVMIAVAVAAIPAYRMLTQRGAGAPKRTILAVLPVGNVPGDAGAESLAAGIAAVFVSNLGTVPGVRLLSGAATAAYRDNRTDVAKIARELDADAVVDLSLQEGGEAHATMRGSLARPGQLAADWTQTIAGDVLTVERQLLESVARTLERRDVFGRRLTAEDWTRLLRMPTTDRQAMSEYSTARSLLEHVDREGNLDRAVALFTSATARDPSFALAYAGLAEAHASRYGRRKDPAAAAQAIAAAEAALKLDPSQAAVRTSLGSIKRLTGQPEQAIAEFRKALALQPNNDDTRRQLGQTLAANGQIDEGIAEIQHAIEVRPDYWNNYFTLGYVLYTAGRYQDAITAYRRTTELNPTFPGGYQMLGTAQHKLGDVEAAIGNYEHAVRLGPNAAAYSNLGFFYYSTERYREAIAAYSEAVKRDPAAPTYHRNLADSYRRAGNTTAARAEYEHALDTANAALAVNPRDALTISLVALCEARLGRAAAAERHAAEAASLPSASRDVIGRQAQVLALIGQSARALAALRKGIQAGYTVSERDDEFDTLRSHPEFKALLKAPGR
jgi:serine/threonine-protein kinase